MDNTHCKINEAGIDSPSDGFEDTLVIDYNDLATGDRTPLRVSIEATKSTPITSVVDESPLLKNVEVESEPTKYEKTIEPSSMLSQTSALNEKYEQRENPTSHAGMQNYTESRTKEQEEFVQEQSCDRNVTTLSGPNSVAAFKETNQRNNQVKENIRQGCNVENAISDKCKSGAKYVSYCSESIVNKSGAENLDESVSNLQAIMFPKVNSTGKKRKPTDLLWSSFLGSDADERNTIETDAADIATSRTKKTYDLPIAVDEVVCTIVNEISDQVAVKEIDRSHSRRNGDNVSPSKKKAPFENFSPNIIREKGNKTSPYKEESVPSSENNHQSELVKQPKYDFHNGLINTESKETTNNCENQFSFVESNFSCKSKNKLSKEVSINKESIVSLNSSNNDTYNKADSSSFIVQPSDTCAFNNVEGKSYDVINQKRNFNDSIQNTCNFESSEYTKAAKTNAINKSLELNNKTESVIMKNQKLVDDSILEETDSVGNSVNETLLHEAEYIKKQYIEDFIEELISSATDLEKNQLTSDEVLPAVVDSQKFNFSEGDGLIKTNIPDKGNLYTSEVSCNVTSPGFDTTDTEKNIIETTLGENVEKLTMNILTDRFKIYNKEANPAHDKVALVLDRDGNEVDSEGILNETEKNEKQLDEMTSKEECIFLQSLTRNNEGMEEQVKNWETISDNMFSTQKLISNKVKTTVHYKLQHTDIDHKVEVKNEGGSENFDKCEISGKNHDIENKTNQIIHPRDEIVKLELNDESSIENNALKQLTESEENQLLQESGDSYDECNDLTEDTAFVEVEVQPMEEAISVDLSEGELLSRKRAGCEDSIMIQPAQTEISITNLIQEDTSTEITKNVSFTINTVNHEEDRNVLKSKYSDEAPLVKIMSNCSKQVEELDTAEDVLDDDYDCLTEDSFPRNDLDDFFKKEKEKRSDKDMDVILGEVMEEIIVNVVKSIDLDITVNKIINNSAKDTDRDSNRVLRSKVQGTIPLIVQVKTLPTTDLKKSKPVVQHTSDVVPFVPKLKKMRTFKEITPETEVKQMRSRTARVPVRQVVMKTRSWQERKKDNTNIANKGSGTNKTSSVSPVKAKQIEKSVAFVSPTSSRKRKSPVNLKTACPTKRKNVGFPSTVVPSVKKPAVSSPVQPTVRSSNNRKRALDEISALVDSKKRKLSSSSTKESQTVALPKKSLSPRNVAVKSTGTRSQVAKKRNPWKAGFLLQRIKQSEPVLLRSRLRNKIEITDQVQNYEKNLVRGCHVRLVRMTEIDRLLPSKISSSFKFCELCEPKRMYLSKESLINHIKEDHYSEIGVTSPVMQTDCCKSSENVSKVCTTVDVPKKSKKRSLEVVCVDSDDKKEVEDFQLTCYICDDNFSSQTDLDEHILRHQREDRDPLSIEVTTDSELEEAKNNIFQSDCFASKMMRRSGKLILRLRREKISYGCRRCPAIFYSKEQLKSHKSYHKNKYQCQLCLKTFRDELQLNAHEINHTISVKEERLSPSIQIIEENLLSSIVSPVNSVEKKLTARKSTATRPRPFQKKSLSFVTDIGISSGPVTRSSKRKKT